LSDDLRGRSVRGGAVTITNQGFKFVIALGATAVLARLLTPEDFGLIGMAMAVIGFIAVFKDLGLSMATIQRADVSHAQVSTLFWINVGVSFVMMLFVASLAPLLAWYYKEPRVEQITLILAGTIIFSGLIVQHQALLRRQMRFGALAMAEIAGIVLAFASGIVAALAGMGYWSLVIIPVVREVVMMLGVWTFCRWRPGRPARHSGVRAMVSFGAHLTGFNLVNYFARNLDKILIGRFSGAAALGFYEKAYQMLLLPIQQINNPITGVAVPTLSRLQKETARYQAYYRRGVFLTVSIGMPLVVFLFVAADKAVLTLLGDQWVESIAIFRALGPAAFVGTFNMATGWVYLSLGETKRQFIWGIFGSAAIVLAYLIGIRWGPIGIALAYSASLVILFPLALVYCFRVAPLGFSDFLSAVRRPATAAILAGAGLFGLNTLFEPSFVVAAQLLLDFFLYAVLYVAIWVGLPNGRDAAREVIDIAKQLRPNPSRTENDI
jgi:PST family polysaccharide transporter